MNALLFVGLSPLTLLLFHALLVRIMAWCKPEIGNQTVILIAILLFNLPLIGSACAIMGRDLVGQLYVILTANCFAYCYFHLFNMSETARRIKVLVGIHSSKVKTLGDLAGYYDTGNALELRLSRLEKISQLKRLKNGNYAIQNALLYYVAFLIPLFRRLLGFRDIEF